MLSFRSPHLLRNPPVLPNHGGSMAKRARHTYAPRQRAAILAAAQRHGLTANDVKKKFGVVPVTYYSWRKKEGLTGPRGRKATLTALRNNGAAFTAQVQAKVRAIM